MQNRGFHPRQRVRLGALAEAYRARHGVAVEWVKAAVGAGQEYENPVARAVLSARGGWVECLDLPLEFSGAVGGPAPYRLVSASEALRIARSLHRRCAPNKARLSSTMFALYAPGGIADGLNVYATRLNAAHDVGEFRSDVLPLYARCRMDRPHRVAGLPPERGVVFLMALGGDRHLLAMLPHGDGGLGDLADHPSRLEQ